MTVRSPPRVNVPDAWAIVCGALTPPTVPAEPRRAPRRGKLAGWTYERSRNCR
ncbi:hypothetical protein I549_2679 [Mycobacterium avium subsp. avium 2285 (R)]|nr:hypothetical protein I549_2679 [Mycobacterium avium subsp. avium 2285 (R)]